MQAMELAGMKKQAVACALTLYTLISLQGCATRASTAETWSPTSGEIPVANPALDQYIAWVPRSRAQTPTVAMALAHISMGYAREQAARKFCGGDWLLHEAVRERIGPIAVTAPQTIGSFPAWYYRVSLQPGLSGCEQVSTHKLYRAIQENLPEWIRLEMAVTPTTDTVTMFR